MLGEDGEHVYGGKPRQDLLYLRAPRQGGTTTPNHTFMAYVGLDDSVSDADATISWLRIRTPRKT